MKEDAAVEGGFKEQRGPSEEKGKLSRGTNKIKDRIATAQTRRKMEKAKTQGDCSSGGSRNWESTTTNGTPKCEERCTWEDREPEKVRTPRNVAMEKPD